MIYKTYEETYDAIPYKTRQQMRDEMFIAAQAVVFPHVAGMTVADVKRSLLNMDTKLSEEVGRAVKDFQTKYDHQTTAANEAFRKALAQEYLKDHNHPNESKLWHKAWMDGHSDGYESVERTYAELAELLN